MTVEHSDMCTPHTCKHFYCWFRFSLELGLLFMCFCLFVPVLFAFVVLGLVSSLLSQELGQEERLRNDLFLCGVGYTRTHQEMR